ncbi:MAG: LysM peptidoglycan-binding domain-containing protein [Acidobacteriota bacterium]
MRPRLLALVAVLLTAISCTTTHQSATAPTPVTAAPAPTAPAAPAADPGRDEIDALLEEAQDAVTNGADDEFDDCEVAVLQSLSKWSTGRSSDPSFTAYAGKVMDELDRLADELAPEAGELEPPPEPAPVPAERVAEFKERAIQEHFDLPVIVNSEVSSLIDFYTGPYRDRLVAALERASKLLPFIRAELRKANLPGDLAYLPLVESAFNPRARSRARAQGLWQFISGTARLYGLRCDGVVDERNDPFLATKAAVAHLAELHATFGSWELALAAYNSGAGRVERALRRAGGPDDFWTVRRYLPRETRNYVPALWAALVVAKNPGAYQLPVFPETPDCLARIPVEGALDIDVLAEKASVDKDVLADLNPALLRGVTPIRGTYQLAVPCGSQEKIAGALAAIPPDQRIRRLFHVIRPGDTLAAIARRYGSSVEVIASANHVRNPRALKVGQTLTIPRYPTDGRHTRATDGHRRTKTAKASTAHAPHDRKAERDSYTVRRGDTLYNIARKFGTTVAELRQVNGLGGTRIRPGDVLVMP